MLNKVKARFLIGIGGLIAVSFMVMIGYTIGSQSVSKQTENQIRAEANKLVSKKKQEERATVLSDELVKEFLTQYFTKVQLGENNARIKPYMTDSAFSEEEANQNKAINQVYKDYMLDYRFESRRGSWFAGESLETVERKHIKKPWTGLFSFGWGSIRVTTSVEVVEILVNLRGIYFRRYKGGTWVKEYEGIDIPPLFLLNREKYR